MNKSAGIFRNVIPPQVRVSRWAGGMPWVIENTYGLCTAGYSEATLNVDREETFNLTIRV